MSSPNEAKLETALREELAIFEGLLCKGKGTWGQFGYVRDDVWNVWIAKRDLLQHLLRRTGESDS